MDVFISWSGEKAQGFARFLRGWLPEVFQAVEPFMSEEDIAKGSFWSPALNAKLTAGFAIVVVTEANQHSPYVNYEVGALTKALPGEAQPRVAPLLLDLPQAQMSGPMTQLQLTLPTHDEVLRLCYSLNAALPSPRTEEQVRKTFALLWPQFQEALDNLPAVEAVEEEEDIVRSDREILEEVLETVRGVQRRATAPSNPPQGRLFTDSMGRVRRLAVQTKKPGLPDLDAFGQTEPNAALQRLLAQLGEFLVTEEIDPISTSIQDRTIKIYSRGEPSLQMRELLIVMARDQGFEIEFAWEGSGSERPF